MIVIMGDGMMPVISMREQWALFAGN